MTGNYIGGKQASIKLGVHQRTLYQWVDVVIRKKKEKFN